MADLTEYRLEGSSYEYDQQVVVTHLTCDAFEWLGVAATLGDALAWAQQHECVKWAAPCTRCGHKTGMHMPDCEVSIQGALPCGCSGQQEPEPVLLTVADATFRLRRNGERRKAELRLES